MKLMFKGSSGLVGFALLVVAAFPAYGQDELSGAAGASARLSAALKAKNVEEAKAAVSDFIKAYIDAKDAENDKEVTACIDGLAKALSFLEGDGAVVVDAAMALGGMGPDAAKPLSNALKNSKLRKEENLLGAYTAVIRALGQTQSVRDFKTLSKLLTDKNNYVIAAAAEALGNYDSSVKLSVRRSVAEALVKTLDQAYNAAEANPGKPTLQKKFEVVGPPLQAALSRVTNASVGAPNEWRKWLNDNKKKRWN